MIYGLYGVLAMVGVILFFSRKSTLKRVQVETVASLTSLHRLIGFVQKHRGMTANFLQGNKSVLNALKDIRKEVATLRQSLSHSAALTVMRRWQEFEKAWPVLEKECETMTPSESFSAHKALIESLLYLLEDLADTQTLTMASGKSADATNMLWREMPMCVEFIGQARAVGVAVTVKGESSQIDRVKLGYLKQKIDDLSISVFRRLSAAGHYSGSRFDITGAKVACENLVSTINNEFIQHGKVELSSGDYFDMASKTMDAMNKIIKVEMASLAQKH